MEIESQIKKYRGQMNLSQEELAEKIFVSRQTISNWETGKSYPDIHSLLLLSSVFEISLDQLIKGDIEIMKEAINKTEIEKMNRYAIIYGVLLFLTVASALPLANWLGWYAFIPFGILFCISMYFALKIEKLKKTNDVQTYKEIVAFSEGKRLDEISQIQEKAKRPYQKVVAVFVGAGFGIVVCVLVALIMKIF